MAKPPPRSSVSSARPASGHGPPALRARHRPACLSLAGRRPALEAAQADLDAAVAARKVAEGVEGRAWTALQIAEKHARDAHNELEPRLLLLFPRQQRRVDTFFLAWSRE